MPEVRLRTGEPAGGVGGGMGEWGLGYFRKERSNVMYTWEVMSLESKRHVPLVAVVGGAQGIWGSIGGCRFFMKI